MSVSTGNELREQAFRKIMGALDMPDDTGPDYDEWLFNRAWQAAFEAGRVEGREQAAILVMQTKCPGCGWTDGHFNTECCNNFYLAEAIRLPLSGQKGSEG